MTPMIPPLPVNIDSRGIFSLKSPKIFEIALIVAPMLIAPIIPPKAGVAPNTG